MVQQSSIFPIFLRAEYQDSNALNRFQSDAQRAAQAAKKEFQGVAAALDAALSRQRNSAGSLDLGVDELRQAAAAQQQVALAAREVAEATKRAATVNGEFDASMSRATRAAFELANAEEKASRELLEQVTALEAVQRELNQTASATDLVTSAKRRGTTASGNVINSARAERVAFVQLGQQLQDVTVQAQLGTNAFQIFAQQAPQAAFALTGLADNANKTKAAIGSFATFLSGPWGAAIFAATAVLGPFILNLFESGEAADEASRANETLADRLDITRNSYEAVVDAVRDYNAEVEKSAETALQAARAASAAANAALEEARAVRQATAARLDAQLSDVRFRESGGTAFGSNQAVDDLSASASIARALETRLAENEAEIAELSKGVRNTTFDLAVERAAIQGDEAKAIAERFAGARQVVRALGLDLDETTRRLANLNAQEKAQLDALRERTSRSGGRGSGRGRSSDSREAREQQAINRQLEQSGERVLRINERFSEQTRLITQAEQAGRELDRILADVNTRLTDGSDLTAEQRAEFEAIKDNILEARGTIEDALVRPFEDLQRLSEERLQVETLLAQGRIDEAAALQEILRLEDTIGDINKQQREDILDQIRFERLKTAELRAQADLLDLQVTAARTVAGDLRDLLSGRSTDFIGNFRQALLDIQGGRLFEDLFGDTFRILNEELSGNTPQGRANAAYVAEVKKTEDATRIVGTSLIDLANVITQATTQIAGIPANDNGNEITVRGDKAKDVGIERQSIESIADRIAEGIVTPLTSELEDLLGPRFAAQLGTVLTGALSGLVRGGTPGAVLGGLGGIAEVFGAGKGVSKLFDGAIGGTQTGTSVNALSRALGLGGSSTGAQIGGAVGSIFGPAGSIVGALGGNFLGSLFGSTKRGSAILNGNAITGFFGNSSSRKDAAGGLAGSILEAIDRIASELGASVNAAAGKVSIGVRNDSINVDPQGRGFTKTSKFPDIRAFGDDAEAAIAFAVQDLIQDGVITGLSAAENRLLQAGDDIEAALRDVLTFRSVFDRLEEIRDPLGFAIKGLNREFEDLIDLFERAGASSEEFAELEELYSLERARLIEETTDRVVGSLRQLLNDLTIGDSGLSLRTRRANALGEFNDLAARVAAGDTSAFDDFADISQQLLEIERQLFGSTQSYFDRLAQITALTEQAIEGQTNVTSLASSQPSPFDDRAEINRSIDTMNADVTGWLRAINDNLIALGTQGAGGTGGRGGPFPSLVQNF